MPGLLPHGFLVAACEAWPLASEASHAQRTLSLARTDADCLDKPTQKLASALDEWLRPRARGVSLEAIRQIRERAWFDGGTTRIRLADYAALLAHRHLVLRGAQAGLKTEPTPGEPLDHFRWLSLLLPPDLLIAALSATSRTEPAADLISLSTPQLARILDRPVAETHLHVGAAVSFGHLWTGLMGSLAHRPPDARKLERGGKPPFGSGKHFLAMLQAAAIARLLMASFLWRQERGGHRERFDRFLKDGGGLASSIAPRAAWPWGPQAFTRACHAALATAIHGHPKNEAAAHFASIHRHLLGAHDVRESKTTQELIAADPLSAWLTPAEGLALPETRFTSRGLRYLLGPGREDNEFACAFWQYQRIRALTHRHLALEPGTAGLDWFRQHYDRISPLRGALDGARFEASLRLTRHNLHLGALETRTAPEPAWRLIRDLARHAGKSAFTTRSHQAPHPEVGLVLHFLKQRDHLVAGKQRLHADPRQLAHGCRFGAYAYARLKEALAIEAALRHMPELLLVLRGIDVASSELAIPTWALAPFIRHVRRASATAAAALARHRPGWQVSPLRATFHAGEDVRRLVEGLRRVHELIEFGLLCAGDRIGHGLAVGMEPERWARAHPVTIQPAEERLDDLLWELDRYGRGELDIDAARVEFVRSSATQLVLFLHGRPVDLAQLVEARRRRHDPRVLDRIGYPFIRNVVPTDEIDRLVHEHLTHAGLFLRGQRPEEVRVNEGEIRMLSAAARGLRREIARREMTIETNPSSNLLIGDMLTVEEHPAFRLQPLPSQQREDRDPVLLSINTDDPITFATSLADEYAYLYGALLREGIGAHEALAWLDRRREDGWRSRFTIPASADAFAVRELIPPDERWNTGLDPRLLCEGGHGRLTRRGRAPGAG